MLIRGTEEYVAISVLSSQFFCKSKTLLKSCLLKILRDKNIVEI